MAEGPNPYTRQSRKRAIALAVVFCALAVGPGCDRQTFDLLDVAGNAGIAGIAGGLALAGAGTAEAGSDSFGGGGNGNEPDAGAGKAGIFGGHGGSPGSGGLGQAGTGGNPAGCLPGDACVPNGAVCPPSVSFCKRCAMDSDCQADTDAPYCYSQIGRCVRCRRQDDCALDEVCDVLLRCVHACRTSLECADDHDHPLCDPQFGTCVACTKNSNCRPVNGRPGVCAYGTCVECENSNDETASSINDQCPAEKPYCIGLRCQSKH